MIVSLQRTILVFALLVYLIDDNKSGAVATTISSIDNPSTESNTDDSVVQNESLHSHFLQLDERLDENCDLRCFLRRLNVTLPDAALPPLPLDFSAHLYASYCTAFEVANVNVTNSTTLEGDILLFDDALSDANAVKSVKMGGATTTATAAAAARRSVWREADAHGDKGGGATVRAATQSLSLTAAGIGIQCKLHFYYNNSAVHSLNGQGVIEARIGNESRIEATLTLTEDELGLAKNISLSACNVQLHVANLTFSGGPFAKFIQFFHTVIENYLNSHVGQYACEALESALVHNVSAVLRAVDAAVAPYMPPNVPPTPPPRAFAYGDVDFRRNPLLGVAEYALNHVLNASGANAIIDKLTNGTGRVRQQLNMSICAPLPNLANATQIVGELCIVGNEVNASHLESFSRIDALRATLPTRLESAIATQGARVNVSFSMHVTMFNETSTSSATAATGFTRLLNPISAISLGEVFLANVHNNQSALHFNENFILELALNRLDANFAIAIDLSTAALAALSRRQYEAPACVLEAIRYAGLDALSLNASVQRVRLHTRGGSLEADMSAALNAIVALFTTSYRPAIGAFLNALIAQEDVIGKVNALIERELDSYNSTRSCEQQTAAVARPAGYNIEFTKISFAACAGVFVAIAACMLFIRPRRRQRQRRFAVGGVDDDASQRSHRYALLPSDDENDDDDGGRETSRLLDKEIFGSGDSKRPPTNGELENPLSAASNDDAALGTTAAFRSGKPQANVDDFTNGDDSEAVGAFTKHMRTSLAAQPSVPACMKYLLPLLLMLNFALFLSSNSSIGASAIAELTITQVHGNVSSADDSFFMNRRTENFHSDNDELLRMTDNNNNNNNNNSNRRFEATPSSPPQFRIRLPSLFDFSLMNTVRDMWSAGVYPLSIIVFIFSGAWPYTKLILMLLCWLVPVSLLSVRKREQSLMILDYAGRYSLIDSYVLVLSMTSFRYELSSPQYPSGEASNNATSGFDFTAIAATTAAGSDSAQFPQGAATFNVYILPSLGFHTFLLATLLSLALTHIILAYHRHAPGSGWLVVPSTANASHGGSGSSSGSSSSVAARISERREALCTHSFKLKRARKRATKRGESERVYRCTRFGYLFIAFLLVFAIFSILIGIWVDSFDFQFGGLAAYVQQYLHMPTYKSESVLSLGAGLPAASDDPNGLSIRWIQATYVLLTVIVPVAYLFVLLALWLVPLTLRVQRRLYIFGEILQAWGTLDVFLFAGIVSLLQLRQFAAFVVGSHCDLITPILKQFLDEELHHDDVCFDVFTTLNNGTWVLLTAVLIWIIIGSIVMRQCHSSLVERTEAVNRKLISAMQMRREDGVDNEAANDGSSYAAPQSGTPMNINSVNDDIDNVNNRDENPSGSVFFLFRSCIE